VEDQEIKDEPPGVMDDPITAAAVVMDEDGW
jgi:hypothetical protein